MPIDARWIAEDRMWLLTPDDTFEIAEVLDLMRDVDWQNAERYLWDMSTVTTGPGTSGDLKRIVGETRRLIAEWDGSRVAIVATSDLHFGIARMFSAFAENLDIEYHAFRDRAEARSWLLS